MASAAGRVGGSTSNIGLLMPVVGVVGLASAVLAGRRAMHVDWKDFAVRFLTGPGRTSRILLLIYVLLNTKSLPGAWTIRVFGSMIRHAVQLRKPLPPKALFHYSVTRSYTSPGETDYNLHKSNSTYFSDLDVARSQCVMHLMAPGFDKIRRNKQLRIVRDPAGAVAEGSLGVALGAVACSFKKELPPLAGFEMWTRVLAWDRKWLYTMTHFVAPAGKVRPASWDGGSFWASRGRVATVAAGEAELQGRVVASAVGKYVFKLGRFTVHPTYVLEQSGLLPERPVTGWRGGEADVHAEVELPAGAADLADWDWRRVEAERRKGMELAGHFAAIDDAHALFDGGRDGALGQFFPG